MGIVADWVYRMILLPRPRMGEPSLPNHYVAASVGAQSCSDELGISISGPEGLSGFNSKGKKIQKGGVQCSASLPTSPRFHGNPIATSTGATSSSVHGRY